MSRAYWDRRLDAVVTAIAPVRESIFRCVYFISLGIPLALELTRLRRASILLEISYYTY